MVRELKNVGQMQDLALKNTIIWKGAATQSCPLVALEQVKDKQHDHQKSISTN